MSLDIYLIGKERQVVCTCACGHQHAKIEREVFYKANITHNLNETAMEAGIYEACWRPDEIGITKARDIIPILKKGYEDMKARPAYYRQFDSPNGCGTYEDFLPWVEAYLDACKKYPDAIIEVSR